MKNILVLIILSWFVIGCTTPHREHRMNRMHHHHDKPCNTWQHHDHNDQHGSSYWHTHCMEDHK